MLNRKQKGPATFTVVGPFLILSLREFIEVISRVNGSQRKYPSRIRTEDNSCANSSTKTTNTVNIYCTSI